MAASNPSWPANFPLLFSRTHILCSPRPPSTAVSIHRELEPRYSAVPRYIWIQRFRREACWRLRFPDILCFRWEDLWLAATDVS